jgi:hypothetical protein
VSPPAHEFKRMVGFRDFISNIEHRFGFGLFNSESVSLGEDCRSYVFENSLLREYTNIVWRE